ncbi:MAG TPA: ATP-binding cassette domain-containing protein, partial [Spirochaetota bacterium]|nr:ATP-binding cassette domain-containing protein [Spirochaetota bacterium]
MVVYPVEFEGVSLYSKDKKTFLENISFKLQENQKVFIVGIREKERNLIQKAIVGLVKPDLGTIKIMGKDINQLSKKELYEMRKKIGFVQAEEGLIRNISISDNITLPLDFDPEIDDNLMKERLDNLSKIFSLENLLNKKSWALDGFIEKKILFARALSSKPLILLINEPNTYIDRKDIDEMKNIIDSGLLYGFLSENPLVVITTEYREWAKNTGDMIIHLRNNSL